jgi:CRP-like cAMP-binding protein
LAVHQEDRAVSPEECSDSSGEIAEFSGALQITGISKTNSANLRADRWRLQDDGANMDNTPDMAKDRTLLDRIASRQLASAVEKRAKPITPSTSRILFRQGDEPDVVYYLKAGEATLTMHAAEKTILSALVPAGSLLGLPAIMGNKPYSMTATAVRQAEVYRISRDDFKQMIVQAELCFDVVRILAGEVHSARVALGDCLNRQA